MTQQILSKNYDEFEKLQHAFRFEMPIFTSKTASVPYKFGKFPKNLIDEAIRINEKFLDKWQSIIEEYFPKPNLDLFIQYQNKYFTNRYNSDNWKESLFKKCTCKTKQQLNKIILEFMINNNNSFLAKSIFPTIYNSAHMGLQNLAFVGIVTPSGCTPGAELETNTSTTPSDAGADVVHAQSVTGTVDECYDQIAISTDTAVGDLDVGAFDDNGSAVPEDLLTQSSSFTPGADYNFNAVTEYTLTTTKLWLAFNNSSASWKGFIGASADGRPEDTGVTQGTAWPDPFVEAQDSTTPFRMKTNHT